MKYEEILRAGRVQRYHATDIDRKQTVGEHTFGVLAIILEICPNASRELLVNALFHDVGELDTGDLPSPIKRANKHIKEAVDRAEENALDRMGIELPNLSIEEAQILKIADIIEGVLYCDYRLKAGETSAQPIRDEFMKYLATWETQNGGK